VRRDRTRGIETYFGDARESSNSNRFALAALGPVDDPEIGIQADATPSEHVKGWTRYQIKIDAHDLKFQSGENYSASFQISMTFYSNAWEQSVTSDDPAELHLTPERYQAALRDGIDAAFERATPAGMNKARIIVRDLATGAVGSLTIPLSTPALPPDTPQSPEATSASRERVRH